MGDTARQKLRILILDDHAVVRRGVRQILAERFGTLEFGESEAGPEGLGLACGQPWDLVIVAVDLPNRVGLEVLIELKRVRPNQPILVVPVRVRFPEETGTVESVGKGSVYVANSPDELVSGVHRVLSSGWSGQSTNPVKTLPDRQRRRAGASHGNLSQRESEVLRLLGLGGTVKEIAARLALSEKTISTYRNRILLKLGLKTTAELIRYAVINGMAD
jgi:DNA-binding NarL/FixJ family response regulator